MKWINVTAIPETDSSELAIFCINSEGDLWYFFPKRNKWEPVRQPDSKELLK